MLALIIGDDGNGQVLIIDIQSLLRKHNLETLS